MRRIIRPFTLAAAPLLLLIVAACGGSTDQDGDQLSIVTSTSIVADWATEVGGEDVEVTSIVPRDADVHGYVLTPSDIQDIGSADLVVLVGAGLEGAFESEVEENAGGRVLHLADGMDLRAFPDGLAHDHSDEHEEEEGHDDDAHDEDEEGHEEESHDADEGEHDHGAVDPHLYMDIDLAIEAVTKLGDALGDIDEANADGYSDRAGTYVEQLQELDEEIRSTLADLPAQQRYLVTFHDAYGYFAARYDLELLGFIVESPEEQPSASQYASLVDEIRAHDVPYLYIEPQFDAQVVEQLADETGAEVRTLPSGTLSEEYPDYVSFMRAIAEGIAG